MLGMLDSGLLLTPEWSLPLRMGHDRETLVSWLHASQGLFRSAQHKKQAEFLGRSFDNDRDRAAAAKNAFVLLAQHRPQLAAAFFTTRLAWRSDTGNTTVSGLLPFMCS